MNYKNGDRVNFIKGRNTYEGVIYKCWNGCGFYNAVDYVDKDGIQRRCIPDKIL